MVNRAKKSILTHTEAAAVLSAAAAPQRRFKFPVRLFLYRLCRCGYSLSAILPFALVLCLPLFLLLLETTIIARVRRFVIPLLLAAFLRINHGCFSRRILDCLAP